MQEADDYPSPPCMRFFFFGRPMTDLAIAFKSSISLIESKYSILVKILDVLDPNTGDFDGKHIYVDFALEQDLALFVLIHLFGHTIQWNVSDELRQLGLESGVPGSKTEDQMRRIFIYERDATRYGMALLHEAGILDLDQWLSDWFDADWKFLEHFYGTGERLHERELLRPGNGYLLRPRRIPAFTPRHWETRFAF